MKPYYDRDGITIYHGDCLDVLDVVGGSVLITRQRREPRG